MNSRQYLLLLNCALVSSLIDSATARQQLSINEGVTPSKKRALQFGVLENVLNNILSDARFAIPDFTFSQNVPLTGTVEFTASNIECYDVLVNDIDVSIDPKGALEADFNLNTNVQLECGMDYSLQGGSFLSLFSDSGSLTLVSQDNSFDLVASLSPTSLSFPACSFNLGTPELDFTGSATSEILNFFEDTIVGTLDGALGNLDICGDFSSLLGGSQGDLIPVLGDMLSSDNDNGGRALSQKDAKDERDAMRQNLRVRELS